MTFEPGDIVVADIIFSSQTGAKLRPALVVSSKRYNSRSDDAVVLKITSKSKDYPFDVSISQQDLAEGALKMESVIQADFPVVIDQSLVKQKIGEVNAQTLARVKAKMKELFEM